MPTYTSTARRAALMGTACFAAAALTACQPSASSGQSSTQGKASASPSTQAPLALGQPAPQPQDVQRYNKTGKFSIAAAKVVMGKPADLAELSGKDYQGKSVAWVYVTAKLVGGDTPMRGPMIMSNLGMDTTGNQTASPLIVIGDLSSKPADCHDEDTEATWQKGESHTWCEPFVFPADNKPVDVAYSQGFYNPPLKWTVR